jgi:four helix bundle protein
MAVQSYKDLGVWQKSMQVSQDIETLASRLPAQHRFGLASQLRRASSSIPSNIAEGQQQTTRVYIHHLLIALGSEAELQTQLKLVARSHLAPQNEIDALLERTSEIGRMLRGLVRSLRTHLKKRPDP